MASFAEFLSLRTARAEAAAVAAPKNPWAEYEAEALERARGTGTAHPLLTVSDAEMARVDLQFEVWGNPDAKLAQQDAFFERYGVRRGDDKRTGGVA